MEEDFLEDLANLSDDEGGTQYEIPDSSAEETGKIYGGAPTTALDEALAPSSSAPIINPQVETEKGLIRKMMDAYNDVENKHAVNQARGTIAKILEGPWKAIVKNNREISEEAKQRYMISTHNELENMKHNLTKLKGTYEKIGSDRDKTMNRIGKIQDEKNGLVREYAEHKEEYIGIVTDAKKLREKINKEPSEVKKGDLEMQLHEMKYAGGKLEGVMSKKHSTINQYKVMNGCHSKARAFLSRQMTKLGQEVEWLSTAIVGIEGARTVLGYFFENKVDEVGLGFESAERKEKITELGGEMMKLMGLYQAVNQSGTTGDNKPFALGEYMNGSDGLYLPNDVQPTLGNDFPSIMDI
jgi:hypothetical protein